MCSRHLKPENLTSFTTRRINSAYVLNNDKVRNLRTTTGKNLEDISLDYRQNEGFQLHKIKIGKEQEVS